MGLPISFFNILSHLAGCITGSIIVNEYVVSFCVERSVLKKISRSESIIRHSSIFIRHLYSDALRPLPMDSGFRQLSMG